MIHEMVFFILLFVAVFVVLRVWVFLSDVLVNG
jgi:hypothetical protein